MPVSTRRRGALGILTAALLIAATTVAAAAPATSDRSYVLATATTGGTYYPVGVALATLVKVELRPKQKISMSAIPSAGSGDNVKLLRENNAQFAILTGLYGAWAWNGTGRVEADGPQKHLRSVTMLWQDVEHFVVHANNVKSGTVDDLKAMDGKKFSIGKRNSGTEGSGRTILAGLGIDPEKKFEIAYLGYGPSAEALEKGMISGMNTPAGVPVSAVTRAFAALGDKARILNFTDEQLKEANTPYSLWTRYVIPPNTYPGQTEAVSTIAQPNFLAVHADVEEDAVYQITKTIYENLPFLNSIHKATRAEGRWILVSPDRWAEAPPPPPSRRDEGSVSRVVL